MRQEERRHHPASGQCRVDLAASQSRSRSLRAAIAARLDSSCLLAAHDFRYYERRQI
jgi:hypothetical protein